MALQREDKVTQNEDDPKEDERNPSLNPPEHQEVEIDKSNVNTKCSISSFAEETELRSSSPGPDLLLF